MRWERGSPEPLFFGLPNPMSGSGEPRSQRNWSDPKITCPERNEGPRASYAARVRSFGDILRCAQDDGDEQASQGPRSSGRIELPAIPVKRGEPIGIGDVALAHGWRKTLLRRLIAEMVRRF